MSWKSSVSACLLCVLASPAFAAPSLTISNGGLDGNGNWIWNVSVTPSAAGTPVAVELGLRETTAGSQLLTATKNATNFDKDTPGVDIFAGNVSGDWEVWTDQGGGNMKPSGLQTNLPTDEIFAALGSIDFATLQANEVMTITTAGPLDTRLSTTMQVLGKYGAGSVKGRVAEITGGVATNYNNFAGSASRTAVIGDLNMSGAVTGADFGTLLLSLGKTLGPRNWTQGDLNGTTGGAEVTGADFGLLLGCLGKTTGVCAPGADTPLTIVGAASGSASGSSVGAAPEPASIALVGLAILGGLGLVGRKR